MPLSSSRLNAASSERDGSGVGSGVGGGASPAARTFTPLDQRPIFEPYLALTR